MSQILYLVDWNSVSLTNLDSPGDTDNVLLRCHQLAQVGDVDGSRWSLGLGSRLRRKRIRKGANFSVDPDAERPWKVVRLFTWNFEKRKSQLYLMAIFNFAINDLKNEILNWLPNSEYFQLNPIDICSEVCYLERLTNYQIVWLYWSKILFWNFTVLHVSRLIPFDYSGLFLSAQELGKNYRTVPGIFLDHFLVEDWRVSSECPQRCKTATFSGWHRGTGDTVVLLTWCGLMKN